ncbi:hypothetical protein R5R35_001172 [Gryllus longicercus]|uniref:Adipokinetic hormone 2 n=1 Tax=Gryllus longicercus TaxID=2509291 RepID=A0AAN9V6B3_9ORTH
MWFTKGPQCTGSSSNFITDIVDIMSRGTLVLVLAGLLLTFASAQVNFSTGWGKRSGTQDGCKSSMDSLMYIYKLIQMEAQKIIECEKFAN